MEHLDLAMRLHRQVPVIDGHADSVLGVLEGKRRLAERSTTGHIDWARAMEAGLACTVQVCWPSPLHYPVAPKRVGECVDAILQEIEAGGPSVR
ncbi:MAG: hypothetical protein ACM3XM_18640, partial [Mycobacterium leprae]